MNWSLLLLALSVGVVHTLRGPDHYLPLLGLAKARDWSLRRALGMTVACGLVHCASSFLVLAVAMSLLGSVAGIAWGTQIAAAGLIATGLALAVTGLRAPRERAFSLAFVLVFALGPCEWLLPSGAAAWAEGGFGAALLVSLAFSLATTLTMAAMVAVGMVGLPRVALGWRRAAHGLAGAVCVGCGLAMWVGL